MPIGIPATEGTQCPWQWFLGGRSFVTVFFLVASCIAHTNVEHILFLQLRLFSCFPTFKANLEMNELFNYESPFFLKHGEIQRSKCPEFWAVVGYHGRPYCDKAEGAIHAIEPAWGTHRRASGDFLPPASGTPQPPPLSSHSLCKLFYCEPLVSRMTTTQLLYLSSLEEHQYTLG